MAGKQAESVIKNIIKEITIESSRKGQNVSETLAAFMVKATVLNPEEDFSSERALTKEDVHRLIDVCVGKLLEVTSPALDTVKMQVHFDMNYIRRVEFLQEHRRLLEGRLDPVTREIMDTRARAKEDLDVLYRKIVSHLLLRSGLGSATDIAVVREASAALQSVFPPTELGMFMSLTKPEKQQHLVELTHIVTGIRLFNRESGKGGVGIDELPSILKEAIQATSEQIEAELSRALHHCYNLTSALLHIVDSPLPPPPEDTIQLMKQALVNARQYQTYIKILMADILTCAEQLDQLEQDFQHKVVELQATVQAKTAVPTSQVYPLFVALSQIWCGFQDEVVLLSVLSNLLSTLVPFTKNSDNVVSSQEVTIVVNQSTVLSDEQRKEQAGMHRVDPSKHRKAEFLFPENIKNFEQLPVEFAGYCACSLALHGGLVVPAAPDVGVLQHRGKYFVFSSREAADTFAGDPDKLLSLTVSTAKKAPELIQLLEMHSYLAPLQKGKVQDGRLIEAPVMKADAGTQTDTHFMDSNIVKSYEWNEWELRRKAIKLANLRQKMTHSTQTDLSHYRRDTDTQVYLPRAKAAQTKRDQGTSVPAPSTYIEGLRGRGIPHGKVDLTLDIGTHNNIRT